MSEKIARADLFALEIAGLRRERRLLRKAVRAWTHRRRRSVLRKQMCVDVSKAGGN